MRFLITVRMCVFMNIMFIHIFWDFEGYIFFDKAKPETHTHIDI